ncbi:hypothetical protein [Tychonema sp. LEGE 07196]|nr:hypothetical protein [Tychonema sp. LEGE 07196]
MRVAVASILLRMGLQPLTSGWGTVTGVPTNRRVRQRGKVFSLG